MRVKHGAGWAALLIAAVVAAGCGGSDNPVSSPPAANGPPAPAPAAPGAGPAPSPTAPAPDAARVKVVDVAAGLVQPWGLAFLPDGRMLVTERPGRMRVVQPDGTLAPPLENVPAAVVEDDGGLLDLVLSPNFAADRQIFFTFVEGDASTTRHTAVGRATFAETRLEDVRVIYRQVPSLSGSLHFGSRIAFGIDGNLFVTLGARNENPSAQDLATTLGKVIRITPDGGIPPDNPYVNQPGARPEIFTYGHRNPQGATVNPTTGQLWTVEHGPVGGDEINLVQAGRNYGWPRITQGLNYETLTPAGEATEAPGVESPRYNWPPLSLEPPGRSYSPSGMAFYTGTAQPGWVGNLFVGTLSGKSLMRVQLDANGGVTSTEYLLQYLDERIRDVRMGPDGNLYLLTSNEQGRILRVVVE